MGGRRRMRWWERWNVNGASVLRSFPSTELRIGLASTPIPLGPAPAGSE